MNQSLTIQQGSNGKWYIGYRSPVSTGTCSTDTGSFETREDAVRFSSQISEDQLVRFEKKVEKKMEKVRKEISRLRGL